MMDEPLIRPAEELTNNVLKLLSPVLKDDTSTEEKGLEMMETVSGAGANVDDSTNVDNVKVDSDPEENMDGVTGEDTGNISDIDKGDSDDCYANEVSDRQQSPTTAEVVLKENGSGEHVYGCSLCEKRYKFKKSAEYHIKVHHKAYSLYCQVCGKTFKIKYDLDRHLNVHKGVRPFPCPECEKSFVCRSSLMRHRKLHHLVGDIYKCHNCEKTFRAETDLKRHMYTHTGEKPWSCNLCTKSFVSKSSLTVHKKSHDDSQKFSCAVCHKMFHIRTDLTRHESLHTGNLRWECAVCEKKYSGKSAVKRHVRDAHILGKVKYAKLMKVEDLLNSINESGKDMEEFNAFVKYSEDKSIDNLLKAVDSFIIYKGEKEKFELDLENEEMINV